MRFSGFVLVHLLLAPLALAHQDLGLLPIIDNAALETAGLSMSRRLAIVDSLEQEIYENGAGSDSLRSVLAAHYAGSPLMKHRVWALELHKEFDEPEAPETLLAKSQIYDRTFNPWSAKKSIDAAIEQSPETSITHAFEGAHFMTKGRHALHGGMLGRAQLAYERAVVCEDVDYDAWLGLASVLVARGDRVALAPVSAKLVELRPGDVGALLYDAIANEALGLTRSAERRFRQAMEHMNEETAEQFSEFESFLREMQITSLVPEDMRVNAPPGLIEWWTRLVECEVIFGQPEKRVHGWDTYVGDMYLLLGRPKEHAYYPAMGVPKVREIVALNRWHRHVNEITRQLRGVNSFDGVWIWIVDIGRLEIPFVFQKGAQFASWAPNVPAQTKWQKTFANMAPLNLHRRPEVARMLPTLRARHARFASSFGDSRVECSYSVSIPTGIDEEGLFVRWDLLRLEGQEERRIDRIEDFVADRPRRADLLSEISPSALGGDSRLGHFSAVLDAGSYLARLELRDAAGNLIKGEDERFDLAKPRESLRMSDLVLADSFSPLRDMPSTPAEFVRFGQAIVPHPEYQALPDLDRLHVYYEVYGAQVDDAGLAHLDVLYEIFPAEGYDPYDAGRFDGVSGTPPAVRLLHRDDTTGQTSTRTTVRGTSIELEDLDQGHYVLVVSISDRLARLEARKTLLFAR